MYQKPKFFKGLRRSVTFNVGQSRPQSGQFSPTPVFGTRPLSPRVTPRSRGEFIAVLFFLFFLAVH